MAYIRGRVDVLVDSHENRIGSLETSMRTHSIVGVVYGAFLAFVAWFRATGGNN